MDWQWHCCCKFYAKGQDNLQITVAEDSEKHIISLWIKQAVTLGLLELIERNSGSVNKEILLETKDKVLSLANVESCIEHYLRIKYYTKLVKEYKYTLYDFSPQSRKRRELRYVRPSLALFTGEKSKT